MKRFSAIVLSIVLLLTFASCSPATPEETSTDTPTAAAEKVHLNIAALKGPTGMGMAKLMTDAGNGVETAVDYGFELMASPDEIVAAVASGECDIAACPLNLAAVLYGKTSGGVRMLCVNTLGVLYVVENGDTVHSVADLKGKTVYSSGQGSSPEYVLNYLLEANGLTAGKDVTVEYLSEHSAVTAKAASDEAGIYVLPEPNVTTALTKNASLRVALDLTDAWDKTTGSGASESTLAQGCLIVSKRCAEQNGEAVDAFLGEYRASVDFVNANPAEAAQMIAALEIVPSAAIAEKAIPNCHIVCIAGDAMKSVAIQNLTVLYDANPRSVGGEMPDEDFWYAG